MLKRSQSQLSLNSQQVDTILHFFPQGLCSLDLEMTGLSPSFDKIIEMAGVKITNQGKIITFHQLINPLISLKEQESLWHGLTNEDLRESPTLKKPLIEFFDFFSTTPLLAHNAIFDIGFLIKGAFDYNITLGENEVYDSCRFARSFFKPQEFKPASFKLIDLSQFYEFTFEAHQALDDAFAALIIFSQMLTQFQQQKPHLHPKNYGFLYKLNHFNSGPNFQLPKLVSELGPYIQQKKILMLRYMGGSRGGCLRPVRPLAILHLPQGLMLYAECLQSQMNKFYNVKKIKEIQVAPEVHP